MTRHAFGQILGRVVLIMMHIVEEASDLATGVVVMSPRPGRIRTAIAAPFSRRAGPGESRAVKSNPEFGALQERVLDYIWQVDAEPGATCSHDV